MANGRPNSISTPELIEAHVYAAVGLVKGVYEQFIKPELTTERLALVGGLALGAVLVNKVLDN